MAWIFALIFHWLELTTCPHPSAGEGKDCLSCVPRKKESMLNHSSVLPLELFYNLIFLFKKYFIEWCNNIPLVEFLKQVVICLAELSTFKILKNNSLLILWLYVISHMQIHDTYIFIVDFTFITIIWLYSSIPFVLGSIFALNKCYHSCLPFVSICLAIVITFQNHFILHFWPL